MLSVLKVNAVRGGRQGANPDGCNTSDADNISLEETGNNLRPGWFKGDSLFRMFTLEEMTRETHLPGLKKLPFAPFTNRTADLFDTAQSIRRHFSYPSRRDNKNSEGKVNETETNLIKIYREHKSHY